MTLKQALQSLKKGCIVTRATWLENGDKKYLIPHGDYTKPTEELYAGKLKEIMEIHEAKSLTFLFHADLLTVLEDGTATLEVGWAGTPEDLWADDYQCATTACECDKPELTAEEVAALKPEDIIEITGEESLVELAQKHGHETEIVIAKDLPADFNPDAEAKADVEEKKVEKKSKRGKPADGGEGDE